MIRTEATSAASGAAIEFVVCGIEGERRRYFRQISPECRDLHQTFVILSASEGLGKPSSGSPCGIRAKTRRGHHEQAKEAPMSNLAPANETYQHGHHVSVVANHAKRTADTAAAFFLPFLKPGMRLLDVGCGPGSITAGLALRVEPAHTIGIDSSESVIEMARSLTSAQAVKHLTFEVGNIYEPRFPAGSFDAVFAHQVLQHLRRPIDA